MKPAKPVESLILTLRGQKVILDADLAQLYGVATKRLNEQVKRNEDRFPTDFCFQLTRQEVANLKSQMGTSSLQTTHDVKDVNLRSQIATSSLQANDEQIIKKNHGGRRVFPYAFTEHGALMAANVLNSEEAVKMSVYIVRAFIKQRELLLAETDVLKRLAQIDAKLLKHDDVLRLIWKELEPLLKPAPMPPKPSIGFHAK